MIAAMGGTLAILIAGLLEVHGAKGPPRALRGPRVLPLVRPGPPSSIRGLRSRARTKWRKKE